MLFVPSFFVSQIGVKAKGAFDGQRSNMPPVLSKLFRQRIEFPPLVIAERRLDVLVDQIAAPFI
jgi:hypothetical protein